MSCKGWTMADAPSQEGKLVVVTGANSGIGYETAKELGRSGAKVILACRSQDRGTTALEMLRAAVPHGQFELLLVELSNLDSVKKFASTMLQRNEPIDVLINNAGVMRPPTLQTADGMSGTELQFATNHLGHFALTGLLLPLLERSTRSPRVVNVSSLAARGWATWKTTTTPTFHVTKADYNPKATYGNTKLTNLLFTQELTRRHGSHVLFVSAHPGFTNTNLQQLCGGSSNSPFRMDPWKGALPTLRAACDPNATPTVLYGPWWGPWGSPVITSFSNDPRSKDATLARKVWELSEKITGISY